MILESKDNHGRKEILGGAGVKGEQAPLVVWDRERYSENININILPTNTIFSINTQCLLDAY